MLTRLEAPGRWLILADDLTGVAHEGSPVEAPRQAAELAPRRR